MWPKGYIHLFSGGGGGERGRARRFLTHSAQQLAPQTTTIFQFPRTYYFVQISQPAKICMKNRYFEEQIHWVPLRRQRQRERQKSNRLDRKNYNCTCITHFCTFLFRHCTTATGKCLNLTFYGGRKQATAKFSFSF